MVLVVHHQLVLWYAGGDDHPSGGNYSNVIDYVEFESFGNAVDFGDLTQGRRHLDGCSNGNGGVDK